MGTAFRSEETFTRNEFWSWLERLPASDVNRYELINGRIVMSPPAKYRHGWLAANLHRTLGRHIDEFALGIVLGSSAGFDLPTGDTLEPGIVDPERHEVADPLGRRLLPPPAAR